MPDSFYGICIHAEGVRSGCERSELERRTPSRPPFGVLGTVKSGLPDPKVPAKVNRRRFSAQYNKNILEEAEACKGTPGAIGALLRREGLHSSHLTTWKKQREQGELDGLTPKKGGIKAKPVNPLSSKVKALESDIRRLEGKLEKAETIVTFQEKILGDVRNQPGEKKISKKC